MLISEHWLLFVLIESKISLGFVAACQFDSNWFLVAGRPGVEQRECNGHTYLPDDEYLECFVVKQGSGCGLSSHI